MAQWACDSSGTAQVSAEDARRRGFVNYNLAPEDKLFTCPYVTSHQLLEHRFSRHLAKCRANYEKERTAAGKPLKMAICKWNYKHHLPIMDMSIHEATCPDAASVVDFLTGVQNFNGSNTAITIPTNGQRQFTSETEVIPNGAPEEDWEPDIERNIRNGTGTYDPKKKLAMNKGLIIQHAPGMTTKSERKKFREEQAAAFEARGGDFYDEARSEMSNKISVPVNKIRVTAPVTTTNHHFDVRLHRAKDIAQAQRNAALSADHQSGENRKRRSTHAVDQISAILDMARSENHSTTGSTATSESGITMEMDDDSGEDDGNTSQY